MSFTEHGFSTQVFLNNGGAIEVEKQQFALHILILNSGGKTDQLPDVLVAFGTAGRHPETLSVPGFKQAGEALEVKLASVGNVRQDSECFLVAGRACAEQSGLAVLTGTVIVEKLRPQLSPQFFQHDLLSISDPVRARHTVTKG